MKGYQPNQLGAELEPDPRVSFAQARRNAERRQNRVALRTLDRALRHGEDIFEPISAAEARRELSDSGRILLIDIHPEEQVEYTYQGKTPQDQTYWENINRICISICGTYCK